MGQQPRTQLNMNPSAPARSSGYHQKAMEEIHNSLLPFAKSGGSEVVGSSAASTISNFSTTSGVSSLSSTSGSNGTAEKDYHQLRQMLVQLHNMGYSEVRILPITKIIFDYARYFYILVFPYI